jgi:hypothetical protein
MTRVLSSLRLPKYVPGDEPGKICNLEIRLEKRGRTAGLAQMANAAYIDRDQGSLQRVSELRRCSFI